METPEPNPPAAKAMAEAPPAEGYAPATGLDRQSKEMRGMLEAQAAAKTASDYEHVVWAYGIIWAIFAGYGLFLWRQSRRIRDDAQALRRELEQRSV